MSTLSVLPRCRRRAGWLAAFVLCLGVHAGSAFAQSVASGLCVPDGGAPGPLWGAGVPLGGAIGPGVGGSGVDAFVAQLAGGEPSQPASACAAPPPVATPGSGAEPASLPDDGLDRSAGNPVDVVTGNRYQRQVDVLMPHTESSALSAEGVAAAFGLPPDDSLPLLLARHYNSRSDYALSLGRGWSHSFDTRLARIVRNGRVELQIVQADGRRRVFRPRAAAAGKPSAAPALGARVYTGSRVVDGLVDEDFANAQAAFVWRWPGGRRVLFDADGRLASIVAPNLDTIRLRRDDAGRVVEARDSSGRDIGFEYSEARLAALRLPDGQRIVYDYDAHGQLAGVRYPDGRTQRYHYEDPRAFHLLTGVTDTDGRRSHHAYDDALRVVRSQGIGRSDAQALHFAYALPRRAGQRGLTTVREAARSSRFRWERARDGRAARLVETAGDGCERCPPMGLRSEVDRAGRVVAIGALRLRHDAFGRVVERHLVDRAGTSRWSERLHYPDDAPLSGPTRIERSSVVPGRTLRLDIGYNPRGQVVAIDVAGFAPGRDAPEPIAASLRLQYAHFGEASGRLVSIAREGKDRVLRTTFVHDAQRRLVRIGHSSLLAHAIERDAIGRPITERFPDGSRRTRSFDGAWRLASTSAHGIDVRFDYDAAGRPSGVEWSGGQRWTIRLLDDGVAIESNHGWRQVFHPAAQVAPGAATTVAAGVSARVSRAPARVPVALLRAKPGHQVVVDAAGRRTEYLRDDLGRLVEIRSSHAGSSRHAYDTLGRLARIEFGDGSLDLREYDPAGRLHRREQVADDERVETRFGYEGTRLVLVDHPAQHSRARYDAHGRLAGIEHVRGDRRYRLGFGYDARGRLVERGLPDGSRLLHEYDETGRPDRLGLAANGAGSVRWLVHGVERHDASRLAMRLGNGIRFVRRDDASGRPLSLAWEASPAAPQAALPFRHLRWHPAGLPVSIAHERGEDRYGYDLLGRLIVRERHAAPQADAEPGVMPEPGAAPRHVEYFAYDATGGRIAARRRDGSDWRPDDAGRDAAGRPVRHGTLGLRYGAQRRIVEASSEQGTTRYRYDAFGQRVASEGPRATRGFLHHGRALVAETDAEGRLARQYLRWNGQLVAVLDHGPRQEAAREAASDALTWIHADHLDTPVAATDETGRVVWRGDWDAYGRLAVEEGGFAQPLRLAGQYFDRETGLHDNLLRSYDPDAGRYLEPDPLGLAAGLNPFAYAGGNPLVATDPLGLVLFAFDGTGNGPTGENGEDITNVRRFFEQYDDPHKWYMAGVGRFDDASGIEGGTLDRLGAGSARARVDWMLGTLDAFLGDAWVGQNVPIDVIGFSRGAAMARDFVNRVSSLIDDRRFWARGICVDLRFLGLWDTVAQFGLAGLGNDEWQLAIPSSVRGAFHAVALNEHRALFPLESALGSGTWVVEAGFIGNHADVGGGNAEGDLSKVSLAWMTKMAQAMGVPLRELPLHDRYVLDPRVHDRNYGDLGDRAVYRRDAEGRVLQRTTQRQAAMPGMSWQETAAFLIPQPRRGIDATGQPSIVGRVDMAAYADWLRQSYGIEVRY